MASSAPPRARTSRASSRSATTSPKSLWASLATGKLPYRHGVTGRFSYRTPLNRDEPFLLLPYGVGFRAWGLIPPVERISAPLPVGRGAAGVGAVRAPAALPARVVRWPSVADAAQLAPRRRSTTVANASTPRAPRGRRSSARSRATSAPRVAKVDGDAALTAVALDGFSRRAARAAHLSQRAPAARHGEGRCRCAPTRSSSTAPWPRSRARIPHHLHRGLARRPPSRRRELPANVVALLAATLSSRTIPAPTTASCSSADPSAAHRENPAAARTSSTSCRRCSSPRPADRPRHGRPRPHRRVRRRDAAPQRRCRRFQTYEAERVVVRRGGS